MGMKTKEQWVLKKNVHLGNIGATFDQGTVMNLCVEDGIMFLVINGTRYSDFTDLETLKRATRNGADFIEEYAEGEEIELEEVEEKPKHVHQKMKVVQSEYDRQGADGKVVGTVGEIREKVSGVANPSKTTTKEDDSEGEVRGMKVVRGEDSVISLNEKKEEEKTSEKLEIVSGDEELGQVSNVGVTMNDGAVTTRTKSLAELRAEAFTGDGASENVEAPKEEPKATTAKKTTTRRKSTSTAKKTTSTAKKTTSTRKKSTGTTAKKTTSTAKKTTSTAKKTTGTRGRPKKTDSTK